LSLDKTIALRSVKPLHCSLFLHFHYLAGATPTRLGLATLEIALFLLVRLLDSGGRIDTRAPPSPVTASRPQKSCKEWPCSPFERVKRKYKSNKRYSNSTTK
jgi:hypothetical protein